MFQKLVLPLAWPPLIISSHRTIKGSGFPGIAPMTTDEMAGDVIGFIN